MRKLPPIVIEKGVPLPDKTWAKEPLFPFAKMDVGDSFVLDVSDHTPEEQRSLRSCMRSASITAKVSIAIRVQGERKSNVWRVWRMP